MKNIKKVVLSLIMFSGMYVASAQSWSDDVQFGVRGGLNLSTVVGDDVDEPDARNGFYAGLLAEVPLSKRVSIQPEVFYATQGFDLAEQEGQEDSSFKLDYIQIPVMFKFYIIDGLNIQVGPQFGFKMNEEVNLVGGSTEIDFDTDTIKDFDMQIATGVEYKFGKNLFAQARYTRGLSKMIEDTDAYNSVLSLGVGLMF